MTIEEKEKAAREKSSDWINKLRHDLLDIGQPLIVETQPSIAFDEYQSEVRVAWYNREKTLTLFFGENEASYLKAWGPSVINDMEDGNIESSEQLLELYVWSQG